MPHKTHTRSAPDEPVDAAAKSAGDVVERRHQHPAVVALAGRDIGRAEQTVMTRAATNALSPKKLLHTKWTAVSPLNKEKHFLVTKVIEPEPAGLPVVSIEPSGVRNCSSS